ncbi:MAG: dihydroorotate dehydrogenase-like protein [Synergistales bacterium]|nr:dihydroorotate dehydrogenase-like protein [Synergistales bacterium]
MATLETQYMGLELNNPFIVGASKLTADLPTMKQLEEAGAGALVTASLFEEQVQISNQRMEDLVMYFGQRHQSEFPLRPGSPESEGGPEEHLVWVRKAKEAADIPVIASLNAVTKSVWRKWAQRLADTGVDGLELNFYATPTDPNKKAQFIEEEQLRIVEDIKKELSLPIAVKLSPFYTNPLNVVSRMASAGADAVVLFNRFFQPDIDVDREQQVFTFDLSEPQEHRLPLRFAGLLHGKLKADICCSGGITDAKDAVKMIMAGADTVQMVGTLYKNKLAYLETMRTEMNQWLDARGYKGLNELRGKLDKLHSDDEYAYERAQYVSILMQSGASVNDYPLI